MEKLLQTSDILSWICLQAARFAGLLLVVLTAVIIYDVIGRKFFTTGSFVLQELEWRLHGTIALLAFGYGYIKNVHVRIDVFAHRLGDRTKLRIEFWAIILLLIPFMSLLFWFGYEFAERAFLRNEVSSGGIGMGSRWLIKAVVPASALLSIFGGFSVALRICVLLRRPDLLSTPFESGGLWKS